MRVLLLLVGLCALPGFANEPVPDHAAFRLKAGTEIRRVRMPVGEMTTWKNTQWKGGVTCALQRMGSGVIHLDVSIKVDGKVRSVKSQDLSIGETLVLVPGVDVEAGFFGPGVQFELTFDS